MNLREYEDIIEPKYIYSLLALVSAANQSFGTCSKVSSYWQTVGDVILYILLCQHTILDSKKYKMDMI